MQISDQLTDESVLSELGHRLQAQRIAAGLTQAALAKQAGIAKRTLERMESGEIAQLSSFVRILRALNQLHQLEALLPAVAPSPMDLLKRKGNVRKRASSKRRDTALATQTRTGSNANTSSAEIPEQPVPSNWTWGDDA